MGTGKLRVLCLISGGGSTMHRVAKACAQGELNAQVVHVIANRGSAGGLEKARSMGIGTSVLKLNAEFNGNREKFGDAIIQIGKDVGADLIAQLGWLALTPLNVIEAFEGKCLNQHPGPLDPGRLGFGGKGLHGRAVHAAVIHFKSLINRPFSTEATVHHVTENYDEGPLIETREMEIDEDDTPESLAAKLLPIEHEAVVSAIQQFVLGSVKEGFRPRPLVEAHEIFFHARAILNAIEQYPNG
jgi:folate-dependent phosphoribosylglycinamide formyltransferase PurN